MKHNHIMEIYNNFYIKLANTIIVYIFGSWIIIQFRLQQLISEQVYIRFIVSYTFIMLTLLILFVIINLKGRPNKVKSIN